VDTLQYGLFHDLRILYRVDIGKGMFISHDGEHIIIIIISYEFITDTKSFSGALRYVLLYVMPHNLLDRSYRTYKSVVAPVMSIISLYDNNDSYNCYYCLGSIMFDWKNINNGNSFLPTGPAVS